MFDLINMLSIAICFISAIMIFIALKHREYAVITAFTVLSVVALLWSGLIRLPIPQTLIWMAINISAIVVTLQGIVSFFTKSTEGFILRMPGNISQVYKSLMCTVVGMILAAMIILARF